MPLGPGFYWYNHSEEGLQPIRIWTVDGKLYYQMLGDERRLNLEPNDVRRITVRIYPPKSSRRAP